jgi:type II secretory pathway predicted ATPase ExeA
MYERFYGLHARPFDLTSNLKYLVMTPKHREALSTLEYGVSKANGITLLIGEAGTGKTTLLRKALTTSADRRDDNRSCLLCLNNPALTREEFLDTLARGFQLTPGARHSKSRFLRELEQALAEHRRSGIVCALIVDEAQSLPFELLEEVRLLVNIESDTEKLLNVVLVGQPSLAGRLNDPELRHLKQRVALRCSLPALDLRETAIYVARRVVLAGGKPEQIFTRDAIIAIHQRAEGVPRTINVVCENALLTGYALQQQPVGADLVYEVCRDFDLRARPALVRGADASRAAVSHELPYAPVRR